VSLEQSFEIRIRKESGLFIVESSVFPQCRGEGLTEKEALSDFSEAVADYISGVTKETVDSIVHSDDYTEVVVDVSSDHGEQTRVYFMDSHFSPQKKMLLKLNSFNSLIKQEKKPPFPNPAQSAMPTGMPSMSQQGLSSLEQEVELGLEVLGKELHGSMPSFEDSTEQLLKLLNKLKPGNNSQEGYVFGFPISFN